MKKKFAILLFFLVSILNVNAEIYLISSRAIKDWASVEHKGHWFTTTYNAFPDFETLFNSEYFKSNSTIYVDKGTYSEDITINHEGLTILGNNAFSDWTAVRNEESIITGNIYIKTSNVTINGFKFTGNGRIESSNGTNAKPLSGIKVLHNYFTQSTLTRGAHNAIVKLGEMYTNEMVNNVSSQCRYKDCEISHNYFEGDATHYANCIGIGGAFGTTTILDNYFYDGGTSIHMANVQGTLNIKYNAFKNVGKTTFTAPDGGNKGDFCIAIYRSAFANSTTANIVANEFDGCYGQGSVFPLIRIFHGSSDNIVSPQNYRINVNENTFKNKPSVYPNANHQLAGQNFLLYNDDDTGKDVKFNISNNHYDNRFYMLAWVTLDDGQGMRKVYADQFTCFNLRGHWSTFGKSVLTETEVTNHASSIALDDITVLQSFDIDPLTGDMYFIQKMGNTRNAAYNSLYGIDSNHDSLVITRVPCTSKNGYSHTYSTNIESMDIGYGGHGTNICTVRDKNGELWIWGGGNASIVAASETNSGNDKSATTARFKFQKGTDLNLNVSKDTDKIKIFNELSAGNEYPAADETSRYLCIRTTTSTTDDYHIYNLDDALEGKKTLIKRFSLNHDDFKNSSINNDNGYLTWAFQSFDINGDYIYTFEGIQKGEEGNINTTDPTIVLTCYNWRTNSWIYRESIEYKRITNLVYGEPEGMVIRPNEYGHANLYIALVNGDEGARKVNIYKYIIDYHTGYDNTTQKGTYQGDDYNYNAFANNDYSGNYAMNYSCDTKSINLETSTVGVADSKTITIDNGEYIFGEWYGVISGEDGEAFNVTINPNNAFSETATATVSFSIKSKNTSKNTYNAHLRLFSPLASTNTESNDIIIPLTGTYTGPTTNVESNLVAKDIAININNKILTVENVDTKAINIYSMTGALITSVSNCNSIDVSHLNGVYLANIISVDGVTYTHKIIIR